MKIGVTGPLRQGGGGDRSQINGKGKAKSPRWLLRDAFAARLEFVFEARLEKDKSRKKTNAAAAAAAFQSEC